LELAEVGVAIAANEYEERVRQLRYELRLRYAEFAGESARLAVIGNLIDSLRQSLGLMRARVERGDAAELDAGLLQADLSRMEAQRAGIEGRWQAARSELARLAGFASGEEPIVEAEFLPQSPRERDPLVSRALVERPDLRMARLEGTQSDAERRLAEAEGHANATLSASYSYVKSKVDDTYGVDSKGLRIPIRDRDDIFSVGLSVPLFAKNRNQGAIEASVARTRGAGLRREYLERSIPLEIESALRRLAAARSTLDLLGSAAIRQMETNLNVMRQAYELGQLRLLDVLTEQRRLLDTQLGRADTISEVLRAWAELEKAVGGLLQ
jgi:cobalt-zinc-cadmium efflux system outer membrane protein